MKLLEDVGLNVLRKISDLWSAAGSDSLVQYTGVTRVEPIALIDSDCIHDKMTPEVMQSLQSMFAGYYLQAMAISTNVGNIEVVRHLDRLNPNRSPATSGMDAAGWLMSMESYKHQLPFTGLKPNALALESVAELLHSANDEEANTSVDATMNKDTLVTVKELTNLSVGKLLNVDITDGCHKATIPISIRLMASNIPTSSLVNLMVMGNKDVSAKERYHGWKSGRLEFWRDLVFAQDAIDAKRKNLINDKTGMYGEILKRRRNNALSSLVSMNPSIATASNLLVCSKETLRQVEGEIGGKFTDFKTRQKLFKESYLMIIAVIDKEWERVEFFTNGISTTTQVGLSDMKSANKNSGPDVSEVLKAYQLGSSPSL